MKRNTKSRQNSPGITLEQALKEGFALVEAGRLSEASRLFDLLAREKPSHPDVMHGQARVAWQSNEHDSALELLEKAILAAPSHTPFLILKGDWCWSLQRFDLAIEAWEIAFKAGANLRAFGSRLTVAEETLGRTIDWWPDTNRFWSIGRRKAAHGLWAEAIEAFQKVSFDSDTAEAAAFYREAGTVALNGRQLDVAKVWLDKAIQSLPNDPDVLLNLGNVAQYQKQLQKAEDYYRKVISINPNIPEAYNNLGVVLKNSDRYVEAEQVLREALRLRPDYVGAWNNLGLALQLQKRISEAEAAMRSGLERAPDDLDLNLNLGAVLAEQGRKEEARVLYDIAERIAPKNVTVLTNIGVQEFEAKHYDNAKRYYEEAIACDPTWLPARNNLAALYMDMGRHDLAIPIAQEVLKIDPDYVDALNNMGISYRQINRLGEASATLEKCLSLAPDHKEALSNFAFVCQDLGHFDKALSLYRRAIEVDPYKKSSWDNYLFCANYHPTLSQAEHLAIYRQYNAFVMDGASNPINISPQPAAGRRLRVAYVSGDLRKHPQQHFFMPFLDHHDRSKFEIWCYHNGLHEDEVSQEMISKSDGWRRTVTMSAEEMAKQVASDGIDILVDLAGHTGGNRADVYPYRAAPVQLATLLGWNFGVGLSSMDALIGDYWTLPEGLETYTIEPLIRVPCNTYVCRLDPDLPHLPDLPAKKRGYLTFGTTTRTVRLNDRDLGLWVEVLKSVPDSRLHFNSRNFKDPASINRMTAFFGERGIEASRLEFDYTSPIYRAFENIDVYLDTFPHNNGTTLIEALWYGLPVITKVDRPPFGCIGQSVLHHAGLNDLIATTEAEYVAIAQRLASDWDGLEARRRTQRESIAGTALFDEVSSVRWFEQAYIAMYEKKLEESKQ